MERIELTDEDEQTFNVFVRSIVTYSANFVSLSNGHTIAVMQSKEDINDRIERAICKK